MHIFKVTTVLLLATYYVQGNPQMGSNDPMPAQIFDREAPKSGTVAPGSFDPRIRQYGTIEPSKPTDTMQRIDPFNVDRPAFAPGDLSAPSKDAFINLQRDRREEPHRQMVGQDSFGLRGVTLFANDQVLKNISMNSGVPISILTDYARSILESQQYLNRSIDFRPEDWRYVRFEINSDYMLTGRLIDFDSQQAMCRWFYRK